MAFGHFNPFWGALKHYACLYARWHLLLGTLTCKVPASICPPPRMPIDNPGGPVQRIKMWIARETITAWALLFREPDQAKSNQHKQQNSSKMQKQLSCNSKLELVNPWLDFFLPFWTLWHWKPTMAQKPFGRPMGWGDHGRRNLLAGPPRWWSPSDFTPLQKLKFSINI